jgi:hypothetical protein
MLKFSRLILVVLAMLGAATAYGVQLAYEPVGLAWLLAPAKHPPPRLPATQGAARTATPGQTPKTAGRELTPSTGCSDGRKAKDRPEPLGQRQAGGLSGIL